MRGFLSLVRVNSCPFVVISVFQIHKKFCWRSWLFGSELQHDQAGIACCRCFSRSLLSSCSAATTAARAERHASTAELLPTGPSPFSGWLESDYQSFVGGCFGWAAADFQRVDPDGNDAGQSFSKCAPELCAGAAITRAYRGKRFTQRAAHLPVKPISIQWGGGLFIRPCNG